MADEAATEGMSALFDPEPGTWGGRGDPYLWRAMRAQLAGRPVPSSPSELARLLRLTFRELAEADLDTDPAASVYRAQYAYGGMSSGMICLDVWRERLLPMLAERAGTLPRNRLWAPTPSSLARARSASCLLGRSCRAARRPPDLGASGPARTRSGRRPPSA
jgi:hypothetical protein